MPALAAPFLLGGVLSASCDKMPLLAPSGTVINLFASSKIMAVNGTIEITATVIEQGTAQTATGGGQQQQTATASAGTPVHNGTLVTFTTTIGSIDPKEARTHNGQVNVRLTGDGRSGVAKVTAFSGGARSAELEISIGAAAVERVVLTASPQTIPASGGTIQLTARAEDVAGNALPGVPVTFSATAGTIQNPTVTTDDVGLARTSLTTSRDTDVTAAAGAKTATVKLPLAARMGLTLSATTATPTAGTAVMFSVSVAATANVRSVTLDFGDGSQQSLGSITSSTSVAHVFSREGTYIASATAVDVSGEREAVSTTVVVAPAPRPKITIALSGSAVAGVSTTFNVTVSTEANTPRIRDVTIAFGDGSSQSLGPITSATTVAHVYGREGTYTVTGTVVDVNDVRDSVSTTVVVAAAPRSTITIALLGSAVAGVSTTFTVTVTTPANAARIRDVTIEFGDGSSQSLGPITSATTVAHVYGREGTYTVTATAVDVNDVRDSVSTTVVVAAAARPTVSISVSGPTTPTVGQPVALSVTAAAGNTTIGLRDVTVKFGDGTSHSIGPASGTTIVSHVYSASGTYTASATATDNAGQFSSANTQVVVAPLSVTIKADKGSNPRFFTFTAALSASVAVDHYEWRFGDGTLVTTSGNSATHIYSNAISGRTDVKVTVYPVSGPAVSATAEIDVG